MRWLRRVPLVASSVAGFRGPRVSGPRETGPAGEALLVCGDLRPVSARSFGTLLKRLDDSEKCLHVFPQVQLFLLL